MTDWPADLPQNVLAADFQEQAQPQAIRSSVDVGPAKMRRRYTAAIKVYRMAIYLTTAQKASLETFFDSSLGGGVLPFNWVDHISGDPRTYRFTAPPSYSAAAPTVFKAALELESLP